MKIFNLIFLLVIFILFTFNFKLVNANLNGNATGFVSGVKLEWNNIEDVVFYKINYGDNPLNITKSIDFIEKNFYIFENLYSNNFYYFYISGYDNLGNEIYKSEEIISTKYTKLPLFIIDSSVLTNDTLELTFSNNINKDEDLDFYIESLNNPNIFYDISEIEFDSMFLNKIRLKLDGELVIGSDYKIIILSILDEFSQNIEPGLESEYYFTALLSNNIDLNFNSVEDNIDLNFNSVEDNIDLSFNSADDDIVLSNIGTDLSEEYINSNLLNVASENNRLPQTGPGQILILLLSSLFGFFIFLNRYRKS